MNKLLALMLTCACMLASAQTYKWRDANGRIQYTDTPPPAGAKDVQTLKGSPSPPVSSGAPAQRSAADQEAEFRKRLVEREEAKAKQAKAEEDERARLQNCEQARGQLAALESGARMVTFNAAGERVALDDAGRARSIADAQRNVETWCNQKPPPR